MLKKKNPKLLTGILGASIVLGSLGISASAASWYSDLERWSGASEISTLKKSTDTKNYYMKVDYVGAHYDSVEHWIESKTLGKNYSVHTVTKEGKSASPNSTASKGDNVVLNVKNPVSVRVQVEASGSWSPN